MKKKEKKRKYFNTYSRGEVVITSIICIIIGLLIAMLLAVYTSIPNYLLGTIKGQGAMPAEIPESESLSGTPYALDPEKFDASFSDTKDISQMKKEREQILIGRDKLLNGSGKGQTYLTTQQDFKTTTGAEYVALGSIDPTYFKNLNMRMSEVLEVYPELYSLVDGYIESQNNPTEYANYGPHLLGYNKYYVCSVTRIAFNLNRLGDYTTNQQLWQRDVETGYHPKNTVIEDCVVHEAMHGLEYYLILKQYGCEEQVFSSYTVYNNVINDWQNHTISTKIINEAVNNVNSQNTANGLPTKTKDEMVAEISEYAKKDDAETFAEALTDYFVNGDKAAPLSIEMAKIVNNMLGVAK